MSLRAAILAAPDLKRERHEIPEWLVDGKPAVLYVHEMGGYERSQWRQSLFKPDGTPVEDGRYHLHLLVYTLKDEAGALVFKPDDLEALDKKNEDVTLRLFRIARRLNHMDPEAHDAKKKSSPPKGKRGLN